MKHFYNSLLLIVLLSSFKINSQSAGTMDFGNSTVVLANQITNPSVPHTTNLLLNGFNVAGVSSANIFIALAESGNEAGTDAIGGTGDATLAWIGNGTKSVSSGTLSTNDGGEIGITSVHLAYQVIIGSNPASITITGKKDMTTVGTLVLNSPAPVTDLTLDLTNPTTGSFSDIDEIVFEFSTPIKGGFSIDDLVVAAAAPSNTPPAITIDNSTLNYTEGDPATQIDASATVNDPDGDSDWNGGTLVAQITANGEAADGISITDTDGDGTAITVSGTNILANGTTVGILSASGGIVTNGTALTITFDSDATNAIVQEVLRSLRYRNTSTTPGTSNRTITITANDTNGGTANDTRTVSITTIPNVTSVTVPSNATYSVGQNLDFTVNFDENITVNTTGGTPQLAITIGSTTRQAVFQPASSGTSALTFRYTVQAGDSDTNGIAIISLSANGGTLQNGSGTDAGLTLNNIGSTTNVFVDGIIPTGYSVVIDQSPINAANDDAVSFTFAGAEVGASYNYAFTSSGAPGSVTGSGTIATATDQITSIDISGLADGTITLNVTLTDINGNAGAAATDTETKETVAPTGYSVIIDQSPINAANDDTVSFTFASAEVGASYNYAFTSSGAPGSVTGSGTIATATDQITSIDISGLADGTITLNVTLTDVNGNAGATATDTETKETVAPTGYSVIIDQSPINAANDDAVSFTFASAEVGASYNYAFTSSGALGSVTGSGTIATATDQITSIDISGLADGTITLNVTLTDVNGNTGAAATDTETKETVAPTGYSVVVDQSPINAANDDAVSFTFASAEVGASYNYAFTSSGAPGSVTGSGTIATATDQITSIDISGLADGTITLNVTLTDVNGNTGAAATDTETKETVAPTGYSVVIDQSPINAANDDAVSFTFASAEVGASYNYAFTSSGAPGSVTGSGTIATATDQITSIDISGLADGTITLNVTLTDVNGNAGAAATDTETKDASIPLAPTITTPTMAVTINTATYTLEGTHTEDDVTIHAYIDADNDGVADDNVSLGSAGVSGGDWSFNINITANTVHNLVIQTVDDAGNTSNYVDVPTITHDSTLSTDSITFNKKAMRVYPNPSNGIIQYSYNGNVTINTIEVYNLQGKQILKQKATTTIDISTVANGIYFVKFNANEGSLIKRVVKN